METEQTQQANVAQQQQQQAPLNKSNDDEKEECNNENEELNSSIASSIGNQLSSTRLHLNQTSSPEYTPVPLLSSSNNNNNTQTISQLERITSQFATSNSDLQCGNNHQLNNSNTNNSFLPQCKKNLPSLLSLHPQNDLQLNSRFLLLTINDQVRELQTVIRDKNTSRGDFKFFADRLIRLVVEEGLNLLPTEKIDVLTPTNQTFHGIRYLKGNCGVSIVRSGESMELGLRDCCRSIRIAKILIQRDENDQARVLYSKFPKDIAYRKVLLLYPIMSTGRAVVESVKVLLSQGVNEENLILLNLFCSPKAAKLINQTFSKMFVLTSDISKVCPNHFAHRYFGTD